MYSGKQQIIASSVQLSVTLNYGIWASRRWNANNDCSEYAAAAAAADPAMLLAAAAKADVVVIEKRELLARNTMYQQKMVSLQVVNKNARHYQS